MRILLICILLLTGITVKAQEPQAAGADTSHLRISLVTCGIGVESWQTFGHICLRVIDSAKTDYRHDLIYNYGTFDNFDEGFEYKFLKGTLVYFLSVVPYKQFMREYEVTGREVDEQVLLMSSRQKAGLLARLETNALPRNREYDYDVFLDNCSTRIRDMLATSLGSGLVYGPAFPPDVSVSVRTVYNQYYRNRNWERVALNIFLGNINDRIITNKYIMFIPDFLSICVDGATLDGQKFAAPRATILPNRVNIPSPVNEPFILTCIIALLTILGLTVKKLRLLGRMMRVFVLLLTGLLGCLILFFWLGTRHSGCTMNYNLFWAIPLNLLLPIIRVKWIDKYALAGMALIIVSIVLHILKVQVMPLLEVGPLLLALMLVYGSIYRESRLASANGRG